MKKSLFWLSVSVIIVLISSIHAADRSRNIMMTGFWNPTGRMIAPFCTDPDLNPSGWVGEDWEESGFDVYSFFPTPGTYTGLFEVDYQDCWEDFWKITDSIRPIAIISYGAGDGPWEIEYNARNLRSWVNDFVNPRQPTPRPPDSTVPQNYTRHSTLPDEEVRDAVDRETKVNAWIDKNGNPEAFLCEYIAYLGMWYQSIHSSPSDSFQCQAAGFIHVNDSLLTLSDVKEATIVTLREVIKVLDVSGISKKDTKASRKVSLQGKVDPDKSVAVLTFFLPENQDIELNVYDLKGKLIRNLEKGNRSLGEHRVKLLVGNLALGIYFCRLETSKSGVVGEKVILSK